MTSSVTLFSAPKISTKAAENLQPYSKVYVAPIKNDGRNIQPKIVQRLKKAGFETIDLRTEHLPFTSQGSGFILSAEGHILTCAHVVGSEANATIWIGTNRYIAKVTAIDTNLDVALLMVQGDHPRLQPLDFATATQPRMGQKVFAIGFPVAEILGSKPRLTEGIVNSTVGLNDEPHHVQISIPIQPGNSGSPLLDDHAQLMGMVDATLNPVRFLMTEGAVPQNINFAIKSEFLQAFLKAGKITIPQNEKPANPSDSNQPDQMEKAVNSVVLVRGGIVDEERFRERPLLCGCAYSEVIKGNFFRLRILFFDLRKTKVILAANLDESSTSSEDKVLDSMFQKIHERLLPENGGSLSQKPSVK